MGGTHFMRSSVAELSWAHIYKVKGSENGLVAQIIKVKHFKVNDISVGPKWCVDTLELNEPPEWLINIFWLDGSPEWPVDTLWA